MIFVDRSDREPPKILDKKYTDGATERDRARLHIQNNFEGSFDFGRYKDAEVKFGLHQLFHGKCAYCETFYAASAPMDVEHFRPKGAVHEDSDHPGYWWLAMSWENLLPSCIDCNRRRKQELPVGANTMVELNDIGSGFSSSVVSNSGKHDCFPLSEGGIRAIDEFHDLMAELPLLLNPCVDQPDEHLIHYVDPEHRIGLIIPMSSEDFSPDGSDNEASIRGMVSIQVFGLNRLALVQARTRVIRTLEFLETLIIDISAVIEDIESSPSGDLIPRLNILIDHIVRDMKSMCRPEAPYSSLAKAWVSHFEKRLTS